MSDLFDQVLTLLQINQIDIEHGHKIAVIGSFSYIKVNDLCIVVCHDRFF